MELNLENIEQGITWLAPGFARMMHECAVLSLESQGHRSGVALSVEAPAGIRNPYCLHWALVIDTAIVQSYQDERRATDQAANCLAILLTLALTPWRQFTTSATNNGIDFWLANGDENDFNFFQARLEISGIRHETKANSLQRRLQIKRKQAKKSESVGIPAYICIVEFSTPKAVYVL